MKTSLPSRSLFRGILRAIGLLLLYLSALLLTLWSSAALYIDFHIPSIKHLLAFSYLLVILFFFARAKSHWHRFLVTAFGFLLVLTWWLTLKPSNNRPWQPDVAQTPWATIDNNLVTIHNFRDCTYRAEFDYSCQWLTKTLNLNDLRAVDVAITYWGSPYIAHPIVSFQFGPDDFVAASIETRKEVGQSYSAILGFFRQYELTYIFSNERDLIRLRTNYRTGEEVYLFRTTAGPTWARQLFLDYIRRANQLHDHPEWYNALTRNCTTRIFTSMAATGKLPAGSSLHDWRILLNGRGDEMLYNGGNFLGNLPFPELKDSAHINDAARRAGDSPDFSRLIRAGRPGFDHFESGVPDETPK